MVFFLILDMGKGLCLEYWLLGTVDGLRVSSVYWARENIYFCCK
jgi:hypothetical protein